MSIGHDRRDHDKKDLARRVERLTIDQRRRLLELVSARADRNQSRQASAKGLIAYVSLAEPGPGAAEDLLKYLREALPEYMVPSHVVTMEQLPKLPNGKVDRARLESLEDSEVAADRFSDQVGAGGSFEPPSTQIEKVLADVWSGVLRSDRISRHDHFFEMGGDSILSIQVVSRARMKELPIEATDLFEYPVLSELANVLAERTRRLSPPASSRRGGDLARTAGPSASHRTPGASPLAPLTPIQHWFFDTILTDSHHWNQVVYTEVDRAIGLDVLVESLRRLPARHDALRMRFERDNGNRWSRTVSAPEANWNVELLDVAEGSDQYRRIADRVAADQRGFDLSAGPLARCTVFDRGPDVPFLAAMTIHHLLIDQISVGILLNDLARVISFAEKGEDAPGSSAPTFEEWAAALQSYADSEEVESELDYWRNATSAPSALPWPGLGRESAGFGVERDTAVGKITFSKDVSNALLGEAHRAYNTRPDELVLAAVWMGVSTSFPGSPITIGVERHGRQPVHDLDPSTIAGWMTAYFPIRFPPAEGLSDEEAIMLVKERGRAVPNGGIGYGLLRYYRPGLIDYGGRGPGAGGDRDQTSPDVVFNYLGDLSDDAGGRIRRVQGPQVPSRSDRCERHCVVEVNAGVRNGRLETNWSYHRGVEDTVRSLKASYDDRLRGLVRHCLESVETRFSPSDFPEAGLSQDELDRLFDSLS